MNPALKRFAPFGLYLSLLAALSAAVLYYLQRAWNLPLQISLGLAVIGVALAVILNPEGARVLLTGRQARHGSNALVLSLAFIGIVVVINYIVYNNSKRWDLTENQQFTLAPETIDALASLPEKVTAQAFFTNDRSVASQRDTATGLLDQYKFHSNGKFTYEFIDPTENPIAARAAKIEKDATIVLAMGDRQETVTLASEQELTGALVRLNNPDKPVIYFLSGHGEKDITATDDASYSTLKSTLEKKNYVVKTLSLLAENKIPDDARLIIIAGPTKPVTQGEVEMLKTFLANGKSLIVMEDPLPLTDFGDSPDPLADYLDQSWGIVLGKDMVVDTTSPQILIPFAARYGDSPITQKMRNVTSFFAGARSVILSQASPGPNRMQLVYTAQQSWAETDLPALVDALKNNLNQLNIQPNAGVDIMGPVSLAMTAQDLTTKARVVVFGDSDFPDNANFANYGNGDLIVNSVDWSAEQENLINLTPKQETSRMMMPANNLVIRLVQFGSIVFIPGIVLVGGILVYLQRRRRG